MKQSHKEVRIQITHRKPALISCYFFSVSSKMTREIPPEGFVPACREIPFPPCVMEIACPFFVPWIPMINPGSLVSTGGTVSRARLPIGVSNIFYPSKGRDRKPLLADGTSGGAIRTFGSCFTASLIVEILSSRQDFVRLAAERDPTSTDKRHHVFSLCFFNYRHERVHARRVKGLEEPTPVVEVEFHMQVAHGGYFHISVQRPSNLPMPVCQVSVGVFTDGNARVETPTRVIVTA
jgi:hypothetical protein